MFFFCITSVCEDVRLEVCAVDLLCFSECEDVRLEVCAVDLLCFSVCEDVRLEVCALGELLIAPVERTHVWPVTGVDPNVCSQIEVEGKSFAATFKCALYKKKLLLYYYTQSTRLNSGVPHLLP